MFVPHVREKNKVSMGDICEMKILIVLTFLNTNVCGGIPSFTGHVLSMPKANLLPTPENIKGFGTVRNTIWNLERLPKGPKEDLLL